MQEDVFYAMKKHTLVFDFDGTIADTFHYTLQLSNRLSHEFNFNTIEPHEIAFLKDKTSREIISYLRVPILKIPQIVARAKKELNQEIASINPIEGLKEILHDLKSLNHTMGILTSNSLENVTKFLNNHSLNLFDFIEASSSIWKKNRGLGVLMKNKGLIPEDILYIGDETRDIVAAQKAGVRIAAVTWGYNSSNALKAHNPDYLVNNPFELFDYVRSLTTHNVEGLTPK